MQFQHESIRKASHPSSAPFTSSASRQALRRDRHQRLIAALRSVAYLTSLRRYDEPSFSERARLSRLVDHVDEALRKLLAGENQCSTSRPLADATPTLTRTSIRPSSAGTQSQSNRQHQNRKSKKRRTQP
jgi:hypothetical protein